MGSDNSSTGANKTTLNTNIVTEPMTAALIDLQVKILTSFTF